MKIEILFCFFMNECFMQYEKVRGGKNTLNIESENKNSKGTFHISMPQVYKSAICRGDF